MKRTCHSLIALCLPLLLCGPALAQHKGPYVGAFLGGNMLTTARSSDNQGTFNLTYNPGLQGSAVLGWDLEPNSPIGEGRIEVEYAHRGNRLDKAEFKQGKVGGSGSMTADSLLFNSFGVFRDRSRWAPYFGAGIGAARLAAAGLKVTGAPFSDDSAIVFAYQAGAGIDLTLSDSFSLDLGYRFFGTSRPKLTEADGLQFGTNYFSHSVVLGLRYGF